MNYTDKNVLVLGLGESGLAMALWLAYCGARIRVVDTRGAQVVNERLHQLRTAVPEAEFIDVAELTSDLLIDMDFVAVSPGLVPDKDLSLVVPAAEKLGIPLWSEIELFAQALAALRERQGYTPKILAITGTNGKTTVTRLTGMLCQRAGLDVRVAGNISPSVLDVLRALLMQEIENLPQAWILELSSFQLHMTYTLAPDAAAVLNLTQDHLDWHGSMEAYAVDKARIFGEHTIRILNRDDALVMKLAATDSDSMISTFGMEVPDQVDNFGLVNDNGMLWLAYAIAQDDEEKPEGRRRKKNQEEHAVASVMIQRLMPVDALKIRGVHNAMNALAALALCRSIGLSLASLLHGLRDYPGEPHRVELVATIRDVEYYDDSKGTNVGATVAALNGLGHGGKPNRLLLIAGGDGKGQDFSPLLEPVSKYSRAVFLIGRDTPAIRAVLEATGIVLIDCLTLEEAVQKAGQMAQPGDAVLLSPACASFDMFDNYAHRARVFVEAVREFALSCGEVMV